VLFFDPRYSLIRAQEGLDAKHVLYLRFFDTIKPFYVLEKVIQGLSVNFPALGWKIVL